MSLFSRKEKAKWIIDIKQVTDDSSIKYQAKRYIVPRYFDYDDGYYETYFETDNLLTAKKFVIDHFDFPKEYFKNPMDD
jgi:hypothetical protein